MKVHKLKLLPGFFKEVLLGNKNFEIRKNDRNFHVGDLVTLNEFDPSNFYWSNGELWNVDENEAKTYLLKDIDKYLANNPMDKDQKESKRKEYITKGLVDAHYTGSSVDRIITFVTDYEQKDGYVVFGMKGIE